MLTLPADALAAVLQHARAEYPNEACGIIAGPAQQANGDAIADRHVPMANTAASPHDWFAFDVTAQLRAYAEMDSRGEDPVVLYHSHPRGPATPSPTDIAMAAGGTCLWLIASLGGSTSDPRVTGIRAWQIVEGQATEVEIRVVEREPQPAGPA